MIRIIFLYINTIRFLSIKQIVYRIIYHFFQVKFTINTFHAFSKKPKDKNKNWIIKNIPFPKSNNFQFLNSSHKVLNFFYKKELPKLWLYNLHYFDYIITKEGLCNVKHSKRLIYNWVFAEKDNLKIGLEPYPTSLRIVNWIKWLIFTGVKDNKLNNIILSQTKFLSKQIEWHIMANHLIANAKALLFSGVYFSCKEASGFRKLGEKILKQEIKEQILDDGGHFERSPMYHSIIIEDLLDIIELNRLFPHCIDIILIKRIKDVIHKQIFWLNTMLHTDKEISFFNDSSIGVAQSPKNILMFYNLLFKKNITFKNYEKLSFEYLKNTGYCSIGAKTYKCLIDIGSVGPSYQPGHAHAQIFSFELSIWGTRVFVNTGVSEYNEGERRELERGTKAHNTVSCFNKNSSDVWSSFRVANRAKVSNINIIKKNNVIKISGKHDGYKNILNNAYHERKWEFEKNTIRIHDNVKQGTNIMATLILHPDAKLIKNISNSFIIKLKNKKIISLWFNVKNVQIKDWQYASQFGKLLNTKCLHIFPNKNVIETYIDW